MSSQRHISSSQSKSSAAGKKRSRNSEVSASEDDASSTPPPSSCKHVCRTTHVDSPSPSKGSRSPSPPIVINDSEDENASGSDDGGDVAAATRQRRMAAQLAALKIEGGQCKVFAKKFANSMPKETLGACIRLTQITHPHAFICRRTAWQMAL